MIDDFLNGGWMVALVYAAFLFALGVVVVTVFGVWAEGLEDRAKEEEKDNGQVG